MKQTITRLAMYVKRNIQVLPRTHFCRGQAGSITYYECVSVRLPYLSGMQITSFIHRICYLWPTLFFQSISYRVRFSEEIYGTQYVCFDFLYKFCLKYF
jgi:hypothetical protein